MPEVLHLDKEQIKKILPHREPFLFVDEILEVLPGEYVIGKKIVRKDEVFFKGHFPGFPIFPGVLIVATAAQISAFIILTMPEKENLFGYFTGIENFRFKKIVRPGDILIVKSEVVSYGHGIAKSKAKVFVKEQLVAEGIVSAMFVDKKNVLGKE